MAYVLFSWEKFAKQHFFLKSTSFKETNRKCLADVLMATTYSADPLGQGMSNFGKLGSRVWNGAKQSKLAQMGTEPMASLAVED